MTKSEAKEFLERYKTVVDSQIAIDTLASSAEVFKGYCIYKTSDGGYSSIGLDLTEAQTVEISCLKEDCPMVSSTCTVISEAGNVSEKAIFKYIEDSVEQTVNISRSLNGPTWTAWLAEQIVQPVE